MKRARNALIFLILLVIPLLLAGILHPVINNEEKATISPIPTKVNVPSYVEQAPILAHNDTAMDNYASALLWEGNGSPDTPYIIDGYNITSDGTCIEILNTVRAFEIRNCYVSSISVTDGTGIRIDNVTQAAIIDTFVLNKFWSLDIEDTPAPYIENCTIHDSYLIYLGSCTDATIIECDIYNNTNDGIYLYDCNNSLISYNVITNSATGEGIFVEESYYVTITGNHISHCGVSGIVALLSPYTTIEENIIHDNALGVGSWAGVYIEESDHASIVGNEIYHNEDDGIQIDSSYWSHVFDNEIYDNSDHGINVNSSPNGTIIQNDVHGNGWWPQTPSAMGGVYVDSDIDWTISSNIIWNNTPNGITISYSERIQISNNQIFNHTGNGIYGMTGGDHQYLTIEDNIIHNNNYAGINFAGYHDCNITSNQIYNHSDYGIIFEGNRSEVVGNKIYNCETGIGSFECYNNSYSMNIVYLCDYGLNIVNIGSNITDNIVFDNDYGIYILSSGNCSIYGNDIGWNIINAYEIYTLGGMFILWHDNVSIGNWWHNYNYTGYYNITTDTGIDKQDLFPSRSLDLEKPGPIEYEILETDNVIVWEAYALNPSHYEVFVDGSSVLVEEWDGDDIEFLADGLAHGLHAVEIVVFHISGHSMGNSTTADVEDLTPPSLEGPEYITIVFGDRVADYYTAADPSGISGWAVNDTVNFAIDSTGALTGITDLPVGEYTIRIEVSDLFGHIAYQDVTITVTAPIDGGLPTTLLLVIGAGVAVVVVVVLLVILKKSGT